MLKIDDLLNPSNTETGHFPDTIQHTNTSPTPASTMIGSTYSASRSDTPFSTSSNKHRKPVKGAVVLKSDDIKGQINHPPYECSEQSICLSHSDQDELARQHNLFAVSPSGVNKDDLISGRWRHIPYSSEKKTFGGMTGKQGFDGMLDRSYLCC